MDPLWLLLIGMVTVLGGVLVLRLHPFPALVAAGLLVAVLTSPEGLREHAAARGMAAEEAARLLKTAPAERLAREFGATAGRLGLLVALATLIGRALMVSGAADRIVRSLLAAVGERRAPAAFMGGGYLLAIPIFYDTVFLLLIPLARALWRHTRRNYILYVMAIIAGGTMTHSLVPPTPGPLLVATELGVDIGLMMLMGAVVSAVAGAVGLAYGVWIDRRLPLEPPPAEAEAAETEADARGPLPPLWLSLTPILLPLLLIGGRSILETWGAAAPAALVSVLATLGEANLALAIAAAIALVLMARHRPADGRPLAAHSQSALLEAGAIVLITAAGGAFGGVLQQAGIGERLREIMPAGQAAVLPLAFLVTAVIRAAQGSATVAMITAVGMFGALAGALPVHPVYLALAIGCGSKPLPWMNDSGFWVIGRTSGMTERQTLQTFSVQLTLMGLAGLGVTLLLAALWPLR